MLGLESGLLTRQCEIAKPCLSSNLVFGEKILTHIFMDVVDICGNLSLVQNNWNKEKNSLTT